MIPSYKHDARDDAKPSRACYSPRLCD